MRGRRRFTCLNLLRLYLRLRTPGGWNLPLIISFGTVMHFLRPFRHPISFYSWVHACYIRRIHDVPFLPVHSLSLGLIVVSRFMSTLLMFLSIHSLFPWQSRSNTSIRIPLFTYSNVSRCLQACLLPHRIPHTMIPLQLFLCLRSYPHCPSCWYLSNVVYPTSIGT